MDRVQFSTGAAVGSDGAATATGYSPHVSGYIEAVHVAYVGSPPSTTDVTLADEGDPAGEGIVALANANSDVKLYPRRGLEDSAGAGLTYDGTRPVCGRYAVHGRLKATIAGANAGDSAVVTVWLR